MKGFEPLMSKSMESALGKGIQLGAVFAEVSSARMETSKTLTPLSSIRSQRLSSVSPKSHLRFVLSNRGSIAEVTLHRSALEGTKQIRSDAIELVGSVAARLASGSHGGKRNRQRRDSNLGYNNGAIVQSNAKGRKIFMRVRQAWEIQ